MNEWMIERMNEWMILSTELERGKRLYYSNFFFYVIMKTSDHARLSYPLNSEKRKKWGFRIDIGSI